MTTNTVANIPQRVPFQGWQATGLRVNESAGESWYDGLEASLTKRFSRGLQFLASYTWAKSLDTDAASFFNSQVSGVAIGDNNDPASRKGLTEVSRPHRFVFSYVYEIPGLRPEPALQPGSWAAGRCRVSQRSSPASG